MQQGSSVFSGLLPWLERLGALVLVAFVIVWGAVELSSVLTRLDAKIERQTVATIELQKTVEQLTKTIERMGR